MVRIRTRQTERAADCRLPAFLGFDFCVVGRELVEYFAALAAEVGFFLLGSFPIG